MPELVFNPVKPLHNKIVKCHAPFLKDHCPRAGSAQTQLCPQSKQTRVREGPGDSSSFSRCRRGWGPTRKDRVEGPWNVDPFQTPGTPQRALNEEQ